MEPTSTIYWISFICFFSSCAWFFGNLSVLPWEFFPHPKSGSDFASQKLHHHFGKLFKLCTNLTVNEAQWGGIRFAARMGPADVGGRFAEKFSWWNSHKKHSKNTTGHINEPRDHNHSISKFTLFLMKIVGFFLGGGASSRNPTGFTWVEKKIGI